jgi:hypothetical protein
MTHVHTASRDHRRRLGQVKLTLTAAQDCLVQDSVPDTSSNTSIVYFGWLNWSATTAYGLIQFDLSPLAGKKIVAAKFRLYALTTWGSNVYILIHRILPANDWLEAQATWNNRKTGTAWTGAAGCSTAGTDYDATAAINEFYWRTLEEWKEIALNAAGLADLQYMAAAAANNQGFIIKRGPSGGSCNRFVSSEYGTASLRPQLIVTYEP